MLDINLIVSKNIMDLMKKSNTSRNDLAKVIGVSEQIMGNILDGTRLVSVAELRTIADYYHITVDELMQNSENDGGVDVVRAFMGKVSTESAKEAIRIADELADMIIFHAKVRVNAKTMSQPWEIW